MYCRCLMHVDEHRIAAMIAGRVGVCADIKKVATAASSIWNDVDAALTPIIGKSGVAALYKRSLHTAIADHPCLVVAYEGVMPTGNDFAGLEIALLQQTPEQALAALLALLTTFHERLTFLIGGPLFERLLGSVWDKPSNSDVIKESE